MLCVTSPLKKPYGTLKPHSLSRKWSATTSAVVGVGPSAAVQNLRSSKDKANALAAVHAMSVLHRLSQLCIVDFLMTSGSDLALVAASPAKNWRDSSDQRPHFTTQDHKPSSTNSG